MEDDRLDIKAALGQLGANVSQQNERLGRLEDSFSTLTERVGRVEISVAEIKALLLATLPHLATKADVADARSEATSMKAELTQARAELLTQIADKPNKTYMWGVLAVLLTAYACGLAALAVLR